MTQQAVDKCFTEAMEIVSVTVTPAPGLGEWLDDKSLGVGGS